MDDLLIRDGYVIGGTGIPARKAIALLQLRRAQRGESFMRAVT
jgi:hypothetical protein